MPRRKKTSLPVRIRERLRNLYGDLSAGNKRKLYRVAGTAAAVLILYAFMAGDTGLWRIARLHFEKDRLESQNHQLLVRLIDAEMTKKRLKNDPRYLEYIARTRHLLSRPGEIIYRFK